MGGVKGGMKIDHSGGGKLGHSPGGRRLLSLALGPAGAEPCGTSPGPMWVLTMLTVNSADASIMQTRLLFIRAPRIENAGQAQSFFVDRCGGDRIVQ